ncbi:MAG: InlB B-repeat-containing protein [Clostridiales bacterium]|nr:InlB B-repeat-containing protein [Clostridiales bacterium]
MTKSVKRIALAVMTTLLFFVAVLLVGACDGNKLVRLTFVTNGGTEIAAIEDKAGAQITPPKDPTRDGYSFEGWYLTKDFTGDATAIPSVMPKQDTVYYAKWSLRESVLLTLDVGEGGTLSKTTYEVPAGTRLDSFLADKTPTTDEGLEFDGWYNGATAIDETSYMPVTPLKLKAKYLAQYSIDVYKQEADGSWSTEKITKTGKAYFGEPFSCEVEEAHFHMDNSVEGAYVSTQRLGKNEHFSIYLARDEFFIIYLANDPEGAKPSVDRHLQSVLYASEATVGDATSFGLSKLYRLAGWSTTPSGDIVYHPGDKITDVKTDCVLYAQWDVAYTDIFGGADYIFFPQIQPDCALLVRGGHEFNGVRDGDVFSFSLPNSETLSGKVNAGHTFAYYREAAAGSYVLVDTYYYGENEEPEIDESVTLTLDNYGGATVVGLTDSPVEGIYSLDFTNAGTDYYYFKANDSTLGYFYFFLTEYNGTSVFAMEGYELGIYNEFVLYDINGSGYYTYDALYLDGYGAAAIINAQTYAYRDYGAYCIDLLTGNGYYFSFTDGESFAFAIVQINSTTVAYMRCNEDVRGQYSDEENAAELTLDGYMYGSYNDGSTTYEGMYCTRSTEIFGLLLDFITATGKSFTFRLSLEDGSFTLFHDVKEYYWLTYDSTNGTQITSMPLIVLHDDEQKSADLYLYISKDGQSYAWTLIGKGVYDAVNIGSEIIRYEFELTTIIDTDFIYYISFTSAVFFVNSLDTGSVVLNVYYLHEANSTALYHVLYEANGDGIIHYVELGVSGMGTLYFDSDGTVYEGSLSYGSSQGYFRQNLLLFKTYVNGSGYKYITFEVDSTNNTFIVLDAFPTELYYYDNTWNESVSYDWELGRDITVHLAIDGKGNAAYLKYNDRGSRLISETLGTYAYGGLTVFGAEYYVFTPSDSSSTVAPFRFMILSTGNVEVFLRYDENLDTILTSNAYGTLRLDGFSFEASYTDKNGVVRQGQYRFAENDEKLIYFITSSTIYFIDLTGDSFTVRDALYGVSFIAVDDAFMPLGYVLLFNGYDAVSFYDVSSDSGYPVAIGNYEILDSELGEVLVNVVLDGVPQTFRFAFISMSGYYLCVVQNEVNSNVYIADDWSMLMLDGYGLGTYIGADGIPIEGMYHAVTDTLIAFECADFDRLFMIDATNKTFAYVDNSQYYGVYYASDLAAIWFGDYAMINGVKAYYTVADDGITATLYYFDTSTAPYYYRAQTMDLPKGDSTEMDGKTFYRYTEGSLLTFMYHHEVGTQPIDMELTFTPTGTAEFQTTAVFYGESCYLTVKYEDGKVVVSIIFEYITTGETVFPVVLNYVPDGDSTCEVTIVPITTNLLSYSAIMYYMYYGVIPAGAFGYIDINMYYVGSRYLGYVLADGGFNYITDASGEVALEFENEEVWEAAESDPTYGYMYFVYFERGAYAYEIDFYIDMSTYVTIGSRVYYCYIMYLACVSNTSSDGDYSVTTVQYLNSDFADYDVGTLMDFGLFKDGVYLETEDKATDIRLAPDSSYFCWIVNSSTATQGVLVTYIYNDYGFITGASISVYDYMRIRSDDDGYLFGLLLDENGDIVMIAQIGKQISSGRYYIQTVTALSKEDGVWNATIYGSNYQSVTISITFVRSEGGYTATVTVLE